MTVIKLHYIHKIPTHFDHYIGVPINTKCRTAGSLWAWPHGGFFSSFFPQQTVFFIVFLLEHFRKHRSVLKSLTRFWGSLRNTLKTRFVRVKHLKKASVLPGPDSMSGLTADPIIAPWWSLITSFLWLSCIVCYQYWGRLYMLMT